MAVVEVLAIVVQFFHQVIGEPGKDPALEVCDLFRYLQGLETCLVSSRLAVQEGCDDFNAPYVLICDLIRPRARSCLSLASSELYLLLQLLPQNAAPAVEIESEKVYLVERAVKNGQPLSLL